MTHKNKSSHWYPQKKKSIKDPESKKFVSYCEINESSLGPSFTDLVWIVYRTPAALAPFHGSPTTTRAGSLRTHFPESFARRVSDSVLPMRFIFRPKPNCYSKDRCLASADMRFPSSPRCCYNHGFGWFLQLWWSQIMFYGSGKFPTLLKILASFHCSLPTLSTFL